MAGCNPLGEGFEFAEFANGGDAAEVESCLAGEVLDAGWEVSGQWLVFSGQLPPHPLEKATTSLRVTVQLTPGHRPLTTRW